MAILAAGALLMTSACTSGGPDDVKNILIIKGQTYQVKYAMYAPMEDGFYNIDLDTKDFGTKEEPNEIHGYGELKFSGKDVTVDVSKEDPIYSSGFNWLSGGGYYEASHYKSGTQTAKNGKDGKIILIVDCIDRNGDRFYLNVEIQDERTMVWD